MKFKVHPGQYVTMTRGIERCGTITEEVLVLRVRSNALVIPESEASNGFAEIRWYSEGGDGHYSYEYTHRAVSLHVSRSVDVELDGQRISGLFSE